MTHIDSILDTIAAPASGLLGFHAEVYVSTLTHDPIWVGCRCEIGRTHTYADTVA